MEKPVSYPPLGQEICLKASNGIPVYLSPNPALHSFCLSLYIRGGSLYETAETSGISHLLEHLLFRHIDNLLGGGLSKELDALGLAFDGVTYREFLWFSICGAPKHFKRALEIFSLLLSPLSLTGEDLRIERARVKAEIREDGEKTSLEYFSDGVLYPDTALTRSILGTAGTLDRISISRLSAYKNGLFTKENLFFYVTGCVGENAPSLLMDTLAPYSLPSGKPKENLAPIAKGVFHRGGLVAVCNSRRTAVRLSIDVDITKTTDACLTLLYDILFGDGEECRLHKALSEKTGFVYSFSASLEQYSNIAFIHILYEIPPAKLEESLAVLLHILKDAKQTLGEALPYAKAPYTDNAPFVLDYPKDLNWALAYERHILSLPHASIEERSASFAAVTEKELLALAKEILRPDCLSLSLKANKRRIDEEKLGAMLRSV